ncbi:MAG: hypothetical protein M5R40_04360 [Anaerolineae bacterium]|nr:hypothetical protein [Anaerolineae bacterium]
MTLVYIALAWCAGLVLASSTVQPSPVWWALAGLGALGMWLARRAPAYRLALACLLAGALGAIRFDAARPTIDAGHLASHNDSGWHTLAA